MLSKRTLIIGLLALALAATMAGSAQAAEKRDVNNALTLDIRGLFMKAVSLEYERKISGSVSLNVQALYQKYHLTPEEVDLTAMAGAVGARMYLSKRALDGLYAGLYGVGAYVVSQEPSKVTATSFGASGVLGLKWISTGGIAIDVGYSLGVPIITKISAPDAGVDELAKFGKVGTGVTLALGYAW